ncbi:MAG: DUF1385 domain-containing protein [Firmicutes bacterium]|nr:DUF1385 domain-containing protein [Bacillota bacterium]
MPKEMSKDRKTKEKNPRMGRAGGEALLEGVMMRCGERIAISVRAEDGSINTKESTYVSLRKRHKICNIPIIRGCISYIESMKLSFSSLDTSTELLGLDEELEESKAEKWLRNKFGKGLMDVVMVIGVVLGLALGIGLFALLPTYLANVIKNAAGMEHGWFVSLTAGVVRIVLFVLYMWLVSLMSDIRRTYEYHGAEHKSIACYEAGMELTPENAKTCTRFHPRCGTSFIFVILILSILIYSVVPSTWAWYLQSLCKLALLPFVMGISYEYLMYAGKHENLLTKICSAPGLWMQRITTREPDLEELAVAITSLKLSMPDEFPDFDPTTYSLKKDADTNGDTNERDDGGLSPEGGNA